MFNIGDKVIVVKDNAYHIRMAGIIGKVVHFTGDLRIGVEFDTYNEEFHTCNGHCLYGYGWYFKNDEIFSVKDDSEDISDFEPAQDGDVCDISGDKADYRCGKLKFAKAYAAIVVKCEMCGEYHYVFDSHKHGNGYVCDECAANNHLDICSECGEIIDSGDVVSVDNGDKTICKNCFDRLNEIKYFMCDDCGGVFSMSHRGSSDDRIVLCDRCSVRYTRCNSCDRLVENDDRYYFDGIPYCDEHNPSKIAIHNYSYKPSPVFYGAGDLFMGVELEIDMGECPNSAAKEIKNSVLYCKHDGSLESNGIEIVTHPCTLDYHSGELDWRRIIKIARKYHYKSHNAGTCGLHVHVNRKFFGSSYEDQDTAIAKVILFFQQHWDNIVTFSRRGAYELDRWAKKPYNQIYRSDNNSDLARKTRYEISDTDRYHAVNMQNSNTIEFRIFRGTLNYNTLIATLQFVDGICRYAKNRSVEEIFSQSWDEAMSMPEFDKAELKTYLASRGI